LQDELLNRARNGNVAFLSGGDPMVSTTHTDLRLRAAAKKIETKIIHSSPISSAVVGLTGLQNYRFGKSCSIPFPSHNWMPTTPIETISMNLGMNLHTLVYLDISGEKYMSVGEGISIMETMAIKKGVPMPQMIVGIARAGSSDPFVLASTPSKLKVVDFGPPLHVLVVPAAELETIRKLAGSTGN
jgi:diphthine synthase